MVEAKEEAHKLRGEAEKEYKERRLEVQKFEKRVLQKEETLDKKISQVEEKDARYNEKFRKLEDKENKINELVEGCGDEGRLGRVHRLYKVRDGYGEGTGKQRDDSDHLSLRWRVTNAATKAPV